MCPEDWKAEVRLGGEERGHREGAEMREGAWVGKNTLHTSMKQSYVAPTTRKILKI